MSNFQQPIAQVVNISLKAFISTGTFIQTSAFVHWYMGTTRIVKHRLLKRFQLVQIWCIWLAFGHYEVATYKCHINNFRSVSCLILTRQWSLNLNYDLCLDWLTYWLKFWKRPFVTFGHHMMTPLYRKVSFAPDISQGFDALCFVTSLRVACDLVYCKWSISHDKDTIRKSKYLTKFSL